MSWDRASIELMLMFYESKPSSIDLQVSPVLPIKSIMPDFQYALIFPFIPMLALLIIEALLSDSSDDDDDENGGMLQRA